MLMNAADLGVEILRRYQSVFCERTADHEVQDMFLEHAQAQTKSTEWAWPSGHWRQDIEGIYEASPGPDGLPFALGARTGASGPILWMRRGARVLQAMDARQLDGLPSKGEHLEDPGAPVRQSDQI